MRPSREEADLAVTKGPPAVTQRRYCSLSSRAASDPTPTVTSMPARRRASSPLPLTRGLGSGMAATQREIPAATTASVQGGVRPWWQHGSKETTRVAPRAASPASRRAVTSAWGPPAGAGGAPPPGALRPATAHSSYLPSLGGVAQEPPWGPDGIVVGARMPPAPSVGAAQSRVLLRSGPLGDTEAGGGHRLQPGLGNLSAAHLAEPVPARVQPAQRRFDGGKLGSHPQLDGRIQLPVHGIGGLLGREVVGP